jgi:hypothetical protein
VVPYFDSLRDSTGRPLTVLTNDTAENRLVLREMHEKVGHA